MYKLKPNDFVTITSQFLLISDLSLEQQALLSKIASMQGDKWVLASNAYFAAVLHVTPRTIQRWIRSLEKKGYLLVRYSKKRDGQDERKLFVNLSMITGTRSDPNTPEGDDNMSPPHDRMSPPACHDVTPPRQAVTHSIEIEKDSLEESLSSTAGDTHPKTSRNAFDQVDDLFHNSFWTVYPRKEKKARALEVWRQINPGPQQAVYMIRCLEYLIRTLWKNRDKDKIPLPTSWLNDKGWEDEIAQGWIAEDERRLSGEQAQRDQRKKRVENEARKFELEQVNKQIHAMGEEEVSRFRDYIISTLPPSILKMTRGGKLDGIIDQLMSTYYPDWISAKKLHKGG